jgi:hypothetical protein
MCDRLVAIASGAIFGTVAASSNRIATVAISNQAAPLGAEPTRND